ncbi:PAR1 PROTEIN [Salix viminalis]|uniref:PAR1 PROTEIN n=1 Tax=Salix viminalis TaxID=40686 RepID=A0A9Q0SC65_SALVM|nr:PAR1 PROTEIN [Salix viminalis]
MAPSLNILSVMAIALVICVQGTLGEIACEHLDQDTCAYAISSAGKRCVLEKTDECIKACGLDRKSLGISTDSLLESSFAQQLCSPQCYDSCPNVVDLYFNLAAAEGVFLPKLCEAQEGSARRGLMADIKSSGFVAPGQLHPVKYTVAPAPIKPVKYTVAPAPVEPLKYTVVPAMSPY